MKKLLILVLVLGLASIAGATNLDKLIQLSVNGQPAPDEITIQPSEWITLDIMLADGYAMDTMELDLEIISLGGSGHIVVPDPPESIVVGSGFESWSVVVGGVTPSGIGTIAAMSMGQVEGKLVDYIEFHCDSIGDVMVKITNAGTNNIIGVGVVDEEAMGSIIIHQIPEPATIALLSLGGLLLRRRK